MKCIPQKALLLAGLCALCPVLVVRGQGTQPVVAIHDSELTRALETVPASGGTPTGPGTTGNQWWPTDWHYFVMPEAMKEALRSDGTAFTVVGDSNITAGVLLTNGLPKYPILISLASEAIRNDEIAPLTNYVAAGGFLLVGSSAFTRLTNGVSRNDFAFNNELGVHMVVNGLSNWTNNNTLTTQTAHRLVNDIPAGTLTWRMPSSSEEIPWGISPNHPYLAPHDVWQVQAGDATVLAAGDAYPYLLAKPFGKGYFIYDAAFQPLIGHSGFAPSTYAYVIIRRAIEWAFESANLPVPKLSPWPYQYDAAFMVRHDLENFTNEISAVAASAQVEYNNGAKGDYYFCTGTVRVDAPNPTTIISGLKQAVTSYGATIGPHNGGLKNPNNPSLVPGQYDYWHWGPDEALDVTPSGYSSGKAYALTSISNSFKDVESWMSGTGNGAGLRAWVGCYFNATREDSYDLQAQLNVKIAGDQKLTPFPHWTLSTRTSGLRYAFLSEPVSDWFVNGLVAQSLEPWHWPGIQTSQTMHNGVDFYYSLGALINFYSHTLATGLGDAGPLVADYITYGLNPSLHPRLWSANAVGVYQWWLQRSNAQMSVTFTTNANQSITTFLVKGSTHTNLAVELLVPATVTFCNLQVLTNGVLAGGSSYRINGQVVKVQVGTSVTNATIKYCPGTPEAQVFYESFDGVTAPALPAGWTSSASGAESPWLTQTTTNDTAPNSAYVPDATNIGTSDLVSPLIVLPAGNAQLSFLNNYDLETGSGTDGYDGGVLEIKIGSAPFTDILTAGGSFESGGYTSVIDSNYGNPLAGRQAWSGNSGGFIDTLVNLPPAASGQTNQLRWRCGTDNANGRSGWWIDTVTISSSTCWCSVMTNTAPVLPVQGKQTINELTTLTVTNTATSFDYPPQVLSYTLASPPAGASIDTNGIITWMPTEAQGPSTNTITTIVTDNGFPPLSATNSFTVVVNEVNLPPAFLLTPTNRTINELTTLTVTNSATDPDIPANTLTYTLLVGPTNAAISTSGVITWTPTEAQGPSTNTITTVVTDYNPWAINSQHLSATNSFTVVVNEVNLPPAFVLTPPNRAIAPLVTLLVTNTATDPDIPINTLAYAFLTAPTNASISANGTITWTPTQAQDQSTNVFTTVVTDYNPWAVNSQHLSATNSFTVVVNGRPVVVLSSTVLAAEGCVPTNNAIDPGETVTVGFALKDTGLGNTTNLMATLLATNGVISPSGPQTYGVLVAGGAAISQFFTFTATGSCGGTITTTLQLQDGPLNLGTASVSFPLGAFGTVFTQNFDTVTAPALPSGWTTSASGAQSPWVTTNTLADTAPNAAYSPDATNIGVNALVSPFIVLPTASPQLSFRNNYDLENDTAHAATNYDGGVLEIAIGTNAFTDIVAAGGTFVSGGYNGTISSAYGNPLAGRQSWGGNSGGYITTTVNLPPAAAGQTIQLRWRCASDSGVGKSGWRIDSISVSGSVCCANTPPTLPAQTNRTMAELTTLVATNTATDAGSPANPLTYALLGPPAGAAIDTSGVITWTPTQTQSPGTNTLTTVVANSGVPSLSATNTFMVIVREVNVAPVLPVIPTQTVNELMLLTVTNTASEANIHSTLGYALANAPGGMSIDLNGVITWTPAQTQSPSTNIVTTVVTNTNPYDLVNPHLSATNTFTVIVQEANVAPVLPVIPTQTVDELMLLTVTNEASEANIHSTLGYALVNPPGGISIDLNGVITWTPAQTQSPSTNTVTTVVTNTNPYDLVNPHLSATNTFTVIVREVNVAPVLPVIPTQTVNELMLLTVTNAASEANIHSTLGYALANAPGGMSIDLNGVITWTPAQTQSPSTNIVTTVVTNTNPYDLVNPHLSATNTFTVIVQEANVAPVLPVIPTQTVDELTLLTVTNTASEANIHSTLGYTLVNPPDGMDIDNNGIITWTPAQTQSPSTNIVTTVVTNTNPYDLVNPHLSATNTFTVIVREVNVAPVLPVILPQTVDELTLLTVTNTASEANIHSTLGYTLVNPPDGMDIDTNGIITWTPDQTQSPSTNVVTTVVINTNPYDLLRPHLSDTNSFLVVVNAPRIVPPPVIESITLSSGTVTITWEAVAGQSYKVQYCSELGGTNWTDLGLPITGAGARATATDDTGSLAHRFYRVVLLP